MAGEGEIGVSAEGAIGPPSEEGWRGAILRTLLSLSVSLGPLLYAVNALRSWWLGHYGVVAVYSVGMGAVLVLWFMRDRAVRPLATAYVSVVFGLGVTLLAHVGPVAQSYLLGGAFIAGVLLGRGAGLWFVATSATAIVVLGGLGLLAPRMLPLQAVPRLDTWLGVALGFAVIGVILVVAFDHVVRTLERALGAERSVRGALGAALREREASLDAVASSEARFQELVHNIQEVFFALDAATWRWLYVSPGAARVWGVTAEEIVERNVSLLELVHPEDRPGLLASRDLLARCLPVTAEFRLMRSLGAATTQVPDATSRGSRGCGDHAWIRLNAWPLCDEDARLLKVVGTALDVTETRVLGEQKAHLEAQLQEAHKMEALARLAGGVAHDVNNMLSIILGHAILLKEEGAMATVGSSDLDAIITAGERSAGMMQQLLAFARRRVVTPQVVAVDEWLRQTRAMYERVFDQRERVVWHFGAPEARLLIEPSHIDQIMVNLLSNANHALRGACGGVRVSTSVAPFAPHCAGEPAAAGTSFVVIEVSDEGVGMAEEVLRHIYEPFYTTRPREGGTGLGLPTVYGIVRQQGGHIEVLSEPGVGTTFRLYLPLFLEDALAAPLVEDLSPSLQGNETLFVLEDEADLRALTVRILSSLGYRVLTAESVHEALQRFEEEAPTIDLLVTDMVMPGLSGREVWELLRRTSPGLRCLFVSGYVGDLLETCGPRGPAWRVLEKPFTPEELAKALRSLLDDSTSSDL